MGIAENIKLIREHYDITQVELADIAGVSDKAISTWEKGIKEPRMGAIQKIADNFNMRKSDLIEDGGVYRKLYSEVEPHNNEGLILSLEEQELVSLFRELHPASKKTVLDLIKLQSTPIVQNEEAERMVERSRENAKRFFEEFAEEKTFKKAR